MKSIEGELSGPELRRQLDEFADRFEAAWRRGEEPDPAEFLKDAPGVSQRELALEIVHLDLEWALLQGKPRTLDYYAGRFPHLVDTAGALPGEIVEHFHALQAGSPDEPRGDAPADPGPKGLRLDPFRTVSPPPLQPAADPADAATTRLPAAIGRYRVERFLGKGGFGCVYLAFDEQLSRRVAIKVPHAYLISRPEDAQFYLAEARTVAGLDHPHIVPVYDVSSAPDCSFFIVSKYVEGTNLATRLGQGRLSHRQSTELVATIAEALHYAHKQGLVHRDVKPGNILVSADGQPFLVDFGLALRDVDTGKGQKYAGTPPYFSPEQARGEGHRVDGRSDIFSLGIVLYEMLVGQRPFRGDSQQDLLEQISSQEPRPPRQYDENIPKDLERICLRALAKRASERYSSAHDLAEDLRQFLAASPQAMSDRVSWPGAPVGTTTGASTPTAVPTPTATPISSQPLKIVPKGLRSFDAHDADFFLELVPGPRDREGLPESVRFWKAKIEETDPDSTFAVGLIYGPSGCGKSSLVKAGLVPRLSPDVVTVYVESTADETEARLLAGLRRRCAGLPADIGLKETLAEIRRGRGLSAGTKVLLVLDQFEQWLHAKQEVAGTELVQALRQCDGGRVQAIVLVRDDFWMAVTRFMRELDIRLWEGKNSAAVDLFDLDHAQKVLAAVGRALGKIPDSPADASREQKEFLKRAVAGLAQEGKIVCVRLALFAEMMKGRPWTPASLKQVGGAEGVGVTFLEETFSAATAPPQHRFHQKAARAVLRALLPETGTDIKGHMRSFGELLEKSGYAQQPQEFQDLIQILDRELRLISPTDPEGMDNTDSATGREPGARYYQLTHDYLVPSVRDWLNRKQKETWKGRAELHLAERAAAWSERPESRHLPAWWEWLNIRLLTRPQDWTPSQRGMMRLADRRYGLQGLAVLLALVAVIVLGATIRNRIIEQNQATIAVGNVRRLLDAETEEAPEIIAEMKEFAVWTQPLLKTAFAEAENAKRQAKTQPEQARQARQQLHASLALLEKDPKQVEYLYERLLRAEPQEVAVICEFLAKHQAELVGRLWKAAEQPPRGEESGRLRAACALALYDPQSPRWDEIRAPVVDQLVRVNPIFLASWLEVLRPARKKLIDPLGNYFRDREPHRMTERALATNILADYASDLPEELANLTLDADEKQFVAIFPKLQNHSAKAADLLEEELKKQAAPAQSSQQKDQLARRQANAGVALLKLNRPQPTWPLLKHSPDPSVRSYLIHRFAPLGIPSKVVIERLGEEKEVSIRRALLLILGEYGADQLPPSDRESFTRAVLKIYKDDPDPGMHGASAWLLRKWRQEARMAEIDKELASGQIEGTRQWYVSRQRQTFVVIEGRVRFMMGSPAGEDGREGGPAGKTETQHEQEVAHPFAIAAREVTVKDFLSFQPDHAVNRQFAPTDDCPVNNVTWHEAAAYCNWLSKQDDIKPEQWCYLPDDDQPANSESRIRMKTAPDYRQRFGYRLTSEVEWEFACRAGAVTSRYYGESEELLPQYGWYIKGVRDDWTIPSGGLKPNDLGLFDMLGNSWERTQDRYTYYLTDVDIGGRNANGTLDQVMRGGSVYRSLSLRCADREGVDPEQRHSYIGFRVARSLPEPLPSRSAIRKN